MIQILGSGTSTGIPEIGCQCEVCTSTDGRDKRLRSSALIETGDARILIDCGPDFREQIMSLPFKPIDGVLITHEHYDHVGGLDDLRPFCKFKDVPIYTEAYIADKLRMRMPYCFVEPSYPGVPRIPLRRIEINTPFFINTTKILPFRVMHGMLPILGFRVNNIAYITDMLTMPDNSFEQLANLDVLIINALRPAAHPAHQNLEQALLAAKRIEAKETYFTHLNHHMGLHEERSKTLPEHMHLAFDGLKISCHR